MTDDEETITIPVQFYNLLRSMSVVMAERCNDLTFTHAELVDADENKTAKIRYHGDRSKLDGYWTLEVVEVPPPDFPTKVTP